MVQQMAPSQDERRADKTSPAGNLTIDHEAIAERRRWILSFARSGGVGAEFGVFRGHFAAVIAREVKPCTLFLVDPWTKLGERFDRDLDPYTDAFFSQLSTAEAFAETRRRMAEYETTCNVVYVEDTLENFAARFGTYSTRKLDFAYLDTSHSYHETLRQLSLLKEIVVLDGVILGDDWAPDVQHRNHGVMRAVNEFLKDSDFQLVLAGQDNQYCLRRTPNYR
jgi:Methyltransferase domain